MKAELSPSVFREGNRGGRLEDSFVPFDAASDSVLCGVIDRAAKSMESPGGADTPSCEEAIADIFTSLQLEYDVAGPIVYWKLQYGSRAQKDLKASLGAVKSGQAWWGGG